MTTETDSGGMPAEPACAQCSHLSDEHILLLVIERFPAPMGLRLCPVSGCTCSVTWRAGTGRSTPAQVAETRELVRRELEASGYPIPTVPQ